MEINALYLLSTEEAKNRAIEFGLLCTSKQGTAGRNNPCCASLFNCLNCFSSS